MRYITSAGVVLEIVRIDRRVIDRYSVSQPAPQPPVREVVVLGGGVEEVPVLDDPDYQAAMQEYRVSMALEQLNILAHSVLIVEPADWRRDPRVLEMHDLGISTDSTIEYLQNIALGSRDDLVSVVEETLYLSTVTERGLDEAYAAFDARWKGIPLEQYRITGGDARMSAVLQARLAATEQHLSWQEFCSLTGPEQSEVVAQYAILAKIKWLADREASNKGRGGRRRL